MQVPPRKRTPEELLQQVQAEELRQQHGRLKVFLGYASGVGKSFKMFKEGVRRHARGEDAVVAAMQKEREAEVDALLRQLEVIPLLTVDNARVMDVPAILLRHPKVCLVDGLAYDNPAGSRNHSRWEDVQELLAAGIGVITTLNIQYIAEVRGRVEKLTGKHVTQTVPQSFLFTADDIEIVDALPEMCLVHSGKNEHAIRLSELREIALLFAADVVEAQLERYLEQNGMASSSFGAQERIMVCITPRTSADIMIQSGKRNADRFHGELIAVYVNQPDLSGDDRAALERNLSLAKAANAEVHILEGDDSVETILNYGRERRVTQIFVGHSYQKAWWRKWVGGNHIDKLIRGAQGMDVRVFPH